MRTNRLLRWSLLVAAACGAVACATAGKPAAEATPEYTSDAAGAEPLPGTVRVTSVDRSALESAGTVKYTLENISGTDQEDLSLSVVFFYSAAAQEGIQLAYDTDVEYTSVTLFRGETREVELHSRAFDDRSAAGQKALGSRLDVEREEVVALVARGSDGPGTLLLRGQLECVGVSEEDLRLGLEGESPRVWLEFENRSSAPVSRVKLSLVFFDPDARGDEGRELIRAQTPPVKVPTLAPGERTKVEFDLAGVDGQRRWPFLVRVTRTGLFG